MKAVLMSVQPKSCELIARGEKTMVICKTTPKLAAPFKVYVYCTKPVDVWGLCRDEYGIGLLHKSNFAIAKSKGFDIIHGAVIGEFVCDDIIKISNKDLMENFRRLTKDIIVPSCLTVQKMKDYLGFKDGYGMDITDFKLYDELKSITDFHKPCENSNTCLNKAYREAGRNLDKCFDCGSRLTRPPQSWCYVEELTV